jgi:hypothetical protein
MHTRRSLARSRMKCSCESLRLRVGLKHDLPRQAEIIAAEGRLRPSDVRADMISKFVDFRYGDRGSKSSPALPPIQPGSSGLACCDVGRRFESLGLLAAYILIWNLGSRRSCSGTEGIVSDIPCVPSSSLFFMRAPREASARAANGAYAGGA